jgi:hypothetical protein
VIAAAVSPEYGPNTEVIKVGDCAVAVVVRLGVVTEVEEDELDVAEDGNVGTGGSVDRCNFGAIGGLKVW